MRIQSQMLAIRIRVDIIIANADELSVDGRREVRGTLDRASRHGLRLTISNEISL